MLHCMRHRKKNQWAGGRKSEWKEQKPTHLCGNWFNFRTVAMTAQNRVSSRPPVNRFCTQFKKITMESITSLRWPNGNYTSIIRDRYISKSLTLSKIRQQHFCRLIDARPLQTRSSYLECIISELLYYECWSGRVCPNLGEPLIVYTTGERYATRPLHVLGIKRGCPDSKGGGPPSGGDGNILSVVPTINIIFSNYSRKACPLLYVFCLAKHIFLTIVSVIIHFFKQFQIPAG